jgi:hypothetical protein
MIPEERAALIVWRTPDEYERELLAAESTYLQAAMEEAL